MKYNNIKKILRKQIDDGVKTFWTYDENKKELIKDGLAENMFKVHLSQIKNLYKNDRNSIPDWINIDENLFIRVS